MTLYQIYRHDKSYRDLFLLFFLRVVVEAVDWQQQTLAKYLLVFRIPYPRCVTRRGVTAAGQVTPSQAGGSGVVTYPDTVDDYGTSTYGPGRVSTAQGVG